IFRDDELWAEVQKQKEKGKIRAIGVSIDHEGFPLDRDEVETVQVIHNRLNRGAEEEVLPKAKEKGLGVLSRVPLASGFLSGKYSEGQRWPDDDVRSLHDEEKIDRRLREVERLQREEVPEGVDMAPWALSWSLRHPAVTTVIPGCKSVEQVRSNASAAELDIAQDEHPQAAEAPKNL
ncbi:MAG: aldo/keto reductase, partial [Planctomycetota bacterium]